MNGRTTDGAEGRSEGEREDDAGGVVLRGIAGISLNEQRGRSHDRRPGEARISGLGTQIWAISTLSRSANIT